MTPLHKFGDFVREQLMLVPLSAVRLLFLISLIVLLIWVIWLPREQTEPPGGAKRWDANLKVPAVLALVIQIVIYSFL